MSTEAEPTDPDAESVLSATNEDVAPKEETQSGSVHITPDETDSKNALQVIDYVETNEKSASKDITNEPPVSKVKPPKPEPELDRIFLFEIILDSLSLSYCTEFMNRCYKGPNFITYIFLGRGPYKLYENKPVTQECINTKVGASHIFCISAREIEHACRKFHVQLQAKRDTPEDTIPLGKGLIDLTALMKCICTCERVAAMKHCIQVEEARKENRIPECGPNMFSETIHKQVVLNEKKCEKAVLLECYVRLTCFGRMMTTPCCITPPATEEFPDYVDCSSACTPR